MGEIGKIVRTVKAEDLPEDVRWHFKAGSAVTTIYEGIVDRYEPSVDRHKVRTHEEKAEGERFVMQYMGIGRDLATTPDEAVSRIRAIRDEWD